MSGFTTPEQDQYDQLKKQLDDISERQRFEDEDIKSQIDEQVKELENYKSESSAVRGHGGKLKMRKLEL